MRRARVAMLSGVVRELDRPLGLRKSGPRRSDRTQVEAAGGTTATCFLEGSVRPTAEAASVLSTA
eukprot:5024858-Pleurochrysis_carterae.AAC.1